VLCIGGMVQLELLDRWCRQDGMYYVAPAHIKVEGIGFPEFYPALVDATEPYSLIVPSFATTTESTWCNAPKDGRGGNGGVRPAERGA
jgi:hypothetical protein